MIKFPAHVFDEKSVWRAWKDCKNEKAIIVMPAIYFRPIKIQESTE